MSSREGNFYDVTCVSTVKNVHRKPHHLSSRVPVVSLCAGVRFLLWYHHYESINTWHGQHWARRVYRDIDHLLICYSTFMPSFPNVLSWWCARRPVLTVKRAVVGKNPRQLCMHVNQPARDTSSVSTWPQPALALTSLLLLLCCFSLNDSSYLPMSSVFKTHI